MIGSGYNDDDNDDDEIYLLLVKPIICVNFSRKNFNLIQELCSNYAKRLCSQKTLEQRDFKMSWYLKLNGVVVLHISLRELEVRVQFLVLIKIFLLKY